VLCMCYGLVLAQTWWLADDQACYVSPGRAMELGYMAVDVLWSLVMRTEKQPCGLAVDHD